MKAGVTEAPKKSQYLLPHTPLVAFLHARQTDASAHLMA